MLLLWFRFNSTFQRELHWDFLQQDTPEMRVWDTRDKIYIRDPDLRLFYKNSQKFTFTLVFLLNVQIKC